MNAIRESVRHEIDLAFEAEERARIREEQGLEEEEEEEEDEGPDPVPAITRAHFEVRGRVIAAMSCRPIRGVDVYIKEAMCHICLHTSLHEVFVCCV